MRNNRPTHSDLEDEARRKANVRAKANVYKRRGHIEPEPCSKCGDEDAEMHHPDYSKPLDVVWLCRSCHLRVHEQLREEELEQTVDRLLTLLPD